jgi:hypothetical protein
MMGVDMVVALGDREVGGAQALIKDQGERESGG